MSTKPKNALYAQSGGVTAVINASACGVIETARQHPDIIRNLYAAHNGIIGVLKEDLIDTSQESAATIAALRYTPAGAFGSCRHIIPDFEQDQTQYERLVEVFSAHDIGYFFYNGGGGSQDAAHKISLISKMLRYPITCIGVPKTMDNDLPFTDNSPGFGSIAKYVAISIREAGMDLASMARTSTKIFIMGVMGRHVGWVAAAGGLAATKENESPHIILFPEIPFNIPNFLNRVKECVKKYGCCSILVSEGLKNEEGQYVSEAGFIDALGIKQLGSVAPLIAKLIKDNLGYKYHLAQADYLQRSARHIAASVDVEQAYAVGKAAVEFAINGKNAVMPIIIRDSTHPYQWHIGDAPLSEVAFGEVKVPREFISEEGYHITAKCREYLLPLIQGEDYPPYLRGLPVYAKLKMNKVPQKLKNDFKIK